jgi:Caspase domain
MRGPFLVHESEMGNSAATHALVIGVGDYPHLIGGTGTLTDDHAGMGQLTSPPISARSFASWLVKSFENPAKPLASVALLLSEAEPAPFVDPVDSSKATPVGTANSENVCSAVEDWFNRGNSNTQNLLIFYFCGHGIAAGTDTALLLSDFGENPLDSLQGAIDFRRFRLGMGRSMAAEQCFFIDACRTASDTLIEANAAGRYIIRPAVRNPEWPPRKAPTFHATLNGYSAYGFPGEPSVYTDALLKALEGFAANDEMGDWRVNTDRIQGAVDHVISRRALKIRTLTPPTSDDASSIYFNHLSTPPRALVYVRTDPPDAIETASLVYQLQGQVEVPAPVEGRNATEWQLNLPVGDYRFKATFPPNRQCEVSNGVRPIFRTVNLRVPS